MMILEEKRILVCRNTEHLIGYFKKNITNFCKDHIIPIRFVVTKTDDDFYYCEVGVIEQPDRFPLPDSIFNFRKRDYENTDKFNAVLLIPTGIGAVQGGHSGDGGAVSRLIAGACDNLITHPNVVNAADINELTDNTQYVEGSVITRLLMGTIGLQKVRANRVMVIVDKHPEKMFEELAINSVSAARVALGLNCPLVIKMDKGLHMKALFSKSGRAIGLVEYMRDICDIIEDYKEQYDALAITTLIDVPENFHLDYFKSVNKDMVNPWGGVEALFTHAISSLYNIPSAHSPMMSSKEVMNLDVGIVDPRKSAEVVSTTYLHCILKGLHRSPRIITNIKYHCPGIMSVEDISCLIIPDGCLGLSTLAAVEQGIPLIIVKDNKNCMDNNLKKLLGTNKVYYVKNYFEAVGVMTALKSGVSPDTIHRPLSYTKVWYI